MTEESGCGVRIERTFDAAPEDVFDAWTSPEVMRRWFHCAPDWDTPEAEVDLRVGGKVRVVMRKPDGTEVEAQGEYTLIDRPAVSPSSARMARRGADRPRGARCQAGGETLSDVGRGGLHVVDGQTGVDSDRHIRSWGWGRGDNAGVRGARRAARRGLVAQPGLPPRPDQQCGPCLR